MTSKQKLSKESIVQSALEMIDEAGEKGFSMRKLAKRLGVDPMALYHHHANKTALMNAVLQAMMEECGIPEPTGNWQTDIRALCQGFRHLAHNHPGAFRAYEVHEDWLPAEHKLLEAFHAVLINAGFPPQETVRAVRCLLAYTESFALDEISGWLAPLDREEYANSLAAGDFPITTALLDEIVTPNTDEEFDFGLTILLRGLAAEVTVP